MEIKTDHVTFGMVEADLDALTRGWTPAEKSDPLSRFRDERGELVESEEFFAWARLEAARRVLSR